MRWLMVPSLIALLALPAAAQDSQAEEDKGFLTGFLESNLSDAGREVRIAGFRGALSSRATFESLTIADEAGVWITLRDGAIGWNRRAIFGGRIEIAELSVAEVELARRPGQAEDGQGDSGLPAAEARGFSLPELPVSVDIGALRAGRVVLGEPVLGEALTLSVDGSMRLESGEGQADLAVRRLDGPKGELTLKGAYGNASRQLDLDLLVDEGAGGIAARLVGLPGEPSVTLAIHGSDPIDAFRADVALSTDGRPRLTGSVRLAATEGGEGAPKRTFDADLGGDISPLLLPQYRKFFGDDVHLTASGERAATGEMALTALSVASQALQLKGSAAFSADGLPRSLDLTLALGLADGSDVLLPLPGQETRVGSARLRLTYDAGKGEDWSLAGKVGHLSRPGLAIAALDLSGRGTIARAAGGAPTADGQIALSASDIAPADPALAEALGPAMRLQSAFQWSEGQPLRFSELTASGAGIDLAGSGLLRGIDSGLSLEGALRAVIADLGRFSLLAGRPLGGAGTATVSGAYGLLSGEADLELRILGRDLSLAQAETDRLLRGESQVTASIRRSTEGTQIRALSLRARTLAAEASGWLRSGATQLRATLDFSDLSVLGTGYGGALSAEAVLDETSAGRQVTATGQGRSLTVGVDALDTLLAGQTDLSIVATEKGGVVFLDRLELANPQIEARAAGQSDGVTDRIDIAARLANLALLVPGFPGPADLTGQVVRRGAGWQVETAVTGPGGTDARITGTLAQDGTADLAIAGSAQAGLANGFIGPRSVEGRADFDLRLNGRPSLAALTGQLRLPGLRISDPELGMAVENAGVTVDLDGGRARIGGSGALAGGGTVTLDGSVGLARPYPADLSVGLAGARLHDPDLYDTRADGQLTIRGPLDGGAVIAGSVTLGETEVRIPSSGLGVYADIGVITHVAEPAPVRATRDRAGLTGDGGAGGPAAARSFGLDITVLAPRRVFVRGRGLDAELGGSLRLAGSTTDVVPIGQFDLIRGRLDLLGKRFDIDEGRIELQGALVPWIRFAANNVSNGVTATILIEGPAAEPEITFSSSPPLPQDEVVAQLLFGRGIESLSVFQAAQLASAVAALTGRGGEGIVSRLRRSFGLDDLDVQTGADGDFALRLGKYVTSNLYTDVSLGADGRTEINLNLDVVKNVTVRGSVASDGETGIGVYYERDY